MLLLRLESQSFEFSSKEQHQNEGETDARTKNPTDQICLIVVFRDNQRIQTRRHRCFCVFVSFPLNHSKNQPKHSPIPTICPMDRRSPFWKIVIPMNLCCYLF